jgi:electron transfer flavoprotein beta subunit
MRKILVAVKRVVDYNTRIRVKPDGSGVMLDGVKMGLNPFDEIALEEALRMRERGQASGPTTCRRTCARRWRWAPTARSW